VELSTNLGKSQDSLLIGPQDDVYINGKAICDSLLGTSKWKLTIGLKTLLDIIYLFIYHTTIESCRKRKNKFRSTITQSRRVSRTNSNNCTTVLKARKGQGQGHEFSRWW